MVIIKKWWVKSSKWEKRRRNGDTKHLSRMQATSSVSDTGHRERQPSLPYSLAPMTLARLTPMPLCPPMPSALKVSPLPPANSCSLPRTSMASTRVASPTRPPDLPHPRTLPLTQPPRPPTCGPHPQLSSPGPPTRLTLPPTCPLTCSLTRPPCPTPCAPDTPGVRLGLDQRAWTTPCYALIKGPGPEDQICDSSSGPCPHRA